MISLKDIQKSYPSKRGPNLVLDKISIDFPKGKNTAIIGQNGAGKSTLLRLLSGAEKADSGIIERDASISWPLGFRGGLHAALTGKQNIAFISRIYGRDFAEVLDYVERFADIGTYMNEKVRSYSSGMRARIAFGMSMAINFDYYLIDEVIAVGDAAFRRKCKIAVDERMQSSTIILISHSNNLMREFCQHGAVLQDGKIHEFSGLNDAIEHYENEQMLR